MLNKKNILYVGNINSTHTKKWIDYFRRQGMSVFFLSTDQPTDIDDLDESIKIFYLKRKILFYLLSPVFVLYLSLRYKIDIYHLHYIGRGIIPLFFIKRRIVSTAWGSDVLIQAKHSIFHRLLMKKHLRKSSIITFDADFMKDELEKYPTKNCRLARINFGTDTALFKGDNTRNSKHISIISTRNFEKVYDLETLIYAFKKVNNEYPSTHLHLVGSGSLELHLKQLTSELQLRDHVTFYGRLTQSELSILLPQMDIYVSTALSDGGIAASTAEAMSCELVPVITDFGENKSWIDHLKCGFVFAPQSDRELADTLIALHVSRSDLRELGLRARETVIRYNCYYTEMFKMLILYQELVGGDNESN